MSPVISNLLLKSTAETFYMLGVSALIAAVVGIPLGILSARSNRLRSVLMPLLDIMQTMPSFVYLIPVLMLFGLGKVPAIFATVIYAVPPLIRLTDLGLRQVDREVMEAQFASLTHRPLGTVEFETGLDLTSPAGRALLRLASESGTSVPTMA